MCKEVTVKNTAIKFLQQAFRYLRLSQMTFSEEQLGIKNCIEILSQILNFRYLIIDRIIKIF